MNYPCFNPNLTRHDLQPLPAPGLSFWMSQETNDAMALQCLTPFSSGFLSSCSNAEQLECQLNWIYNESKLPVPCTGEELSIKESCNNAPLGNTPFLVSTQQEHQLKLAPLPHMSATTLLQKAAQMGVVSSSGPSLLVGFDMKSSMVGELPPPVVADSHYSVHKYDIGAGRDDGDEITRDFLGVGIQALCPSSVSRWI